MSLLLFCLKADKPLGASLSRFSRWRYKYKGGSGNKKREAENEPLLIDPIIILSL